MVLSKEHKHINMGLVKKPNCYVVRLREDASADNISGKFQSQSYYIRTMKLAIMYLLIPLWTLAQIPKQQLISLVNDANNYRLSGELSHYFIDERDLSDLVSKLQKADPEASDEFWGFLTSKMLELKKTSQASWNKRIRKLKRDSSRLQWIGYEDYMIKNQVFGAIGTAKIYHLPRIEVVDISSLTVEKILMTMIELNGRLKIAEIRFEPITSIGFTNAESLTQYLVTSINQKRPAAKIDIMFLSKEDVNSLISAYRVHNPEVTTKQARILEGEIKARDTDTRKKWDKILPDLKTDLVLKNFEQELSTDDALKYRNITIELADSTGEEKYINIAAVEVNGVLRVVQLEHIFPIRSH